MQKEWKRSNFNILSREVAWERRKGEYQFPDLRFRRSDLELSDLELSDFASR
jgi:hypothetical protein